MRDHRGGGRSSARETIARCVAGALAKLVLSQLGIEVWAYTSQVGDLSLPGDYSNYDFSEIESKWQKKWQESKVFEAKDDFEKPKFH